MTTAYIAFGANQGDVQLTYERVLNQFVCDREMRSVRGSRLVQSRPAGGPPDQPDFHNAVVALETGLSARLLLDRLQRLEFDFGRVRDQRWRPRPVDLDLVLFGDMVEAGDALVVPHPLMHFRRFVLEPLVELDPSATHPLLRRTAQQLFEMLPVSDSTIAVYADRRRFQFLCDRLHSLWPGQSIVDLAETGVVVKPVGIGGWLMGAVFERPGRSHWRLSSDSAWVLIDQEFPNASGWNTHDAAEIFPAVDLRFVHGIASNEMLSHFLAAAA